MPRKKTPAYLSVVQPSVVGKTYSGRDADNRREYWLNQFLAMGPSRNIPALAAFSKTNPSSTPICARTLWTYYKQARWKEKAEEFDARNNALIRAKAEAQAQESIQTRVSNALARARMFGSLATQALTTGDMVVGEDGRQHLINVRLKMWHELTSDDIRLAVLLHETATRTERAIDGTPAERADASGQPLVIREPATEDEKNEMRRLVGSLVKRLQAADRKEATEDAG